MHRKSQRAPTHVVRLEARTLLGGAGELMETVGQLDAATVQLEALRHARLRRVEPCERRLTCRIAVDETQHAAAEARPDDCAHQKLQPLIAAHRAGRAAVLEAAERERLCGLRERTIRGTQGVQTE